MKKELNIGVIGCCGRGGISYGTHRPEEGIRLIAGADIYPEKLERFKEHVKDNPFTTLDYRELLAMKEIDAVFVTSPDYCHEEHAIAALEAGKAVYLEKPMTITIEGCDRVLETAYRTGSKLYLGHNMRHFPAVIKMKELVDSGIIGEVQAVWCRHFINYGGDAYFKDWHSEQINSTGLLLQKGAHDIDVIHYVTGAYTSEVSGMGKLSVYDKCKRRSPEEIGNPSWSAANWPADKCTNYSPIIDVEDHNMLMMQLANGVQASYLQCHYTPDAERNYTFIGTKGRIENMGDSGNCQIFVWTQRGCRAYPDIVYNLKEIEGGHGGADPGIVQTFLDFVRFDAPIKTNPIAARNAVAVGVLGHDSMRTDGGRRSIPPVPKYLEDYFNNGQHK